MPRRKWPKPDEIGMTMGKLLEFLSQADKDLKVRYADIRLITPQESIIEYRFDSRDKVAK